MTESDHLAKSDPTHASIWLEVAWEGGHQCFELGFEEERAIVVGSRPGADVRIERPDVAPVNLHFEREGHAVCLVPAYRASLRVNARRVSSACTIERRATVEFSDLSLQVEVHTERPKSADETLARRKGHAAEQPAKYTHAPPNEADPTGVAMRAVRSSRVRWSRFETVKMRAPDATPAAEGDETSAVGPHGTLIIPRTQLAASSTHMSAKTEPPAALGPHGTVIIRRACLEEQPNSSFAAVDVLGRTPVDGTRSLAHVPDPRLPPPVTGLPENALAGCSSKRPRQARTTAGPSFGPLCGARGYSETTQFEVPTILLSTPTDGTPPQAPNAHPPPPEEAAPRTPPAEPIDAVVPRSTRRSAAASVRSWLAALGLAARKYPLVVGGVTLASSTVLALALVGASMFLGSGTAEGPRVKHRLSPTATASVKVRVSAPPEAPNAPVAASTALAIKSEVATAEVKPHPQPDTPAAASTDHRESADRLVAQAVQHLAAGRRQEAERSYAELAKRLPENPAYAASARMLGRSLTIDCADARAGDRSCPELKR